METIFCAICRELVNVPIKHKTCDVSFCAVCINKYLVNIPDIAKCPGCGHPIGSDCLVLNKNVKEFVEERLFICYCGKRMIRGLYENHYQRCIGSRVVNQPGLNIHPEGQGNIIPNPKEEKQYQCSPCPGKYCFKELRQHIESEDYSWFGVCQICADGPGGDPSYRVYLSSHMQSRHQIDPVKEIEYQNGVPELEALAKFTPQTKFKH